MSAQILDLFPETLTDVSVNESPDSFEDRQAGLAAEHFACGVISYLGYIIHHTPSNGYDALLSVSGKILKIQIRGASYQRHPGAYAFKTEVRNGDSKRPIDRRNADLMAYVCLDMRKVLFQPVPISGFTRTQITLSVSAFRGMEIEKLTLKNTIEELLRE